MTAGSVLKAVLLARLGLLAALLTAASPVSAVPDRCAAPDDAAGVTEEMPHLAAALSAGQRLDVLTVGSATVFNPEANPAPGTVNSRVLGLSQPADAASVKPPSPDVSERAFPLQMAAALRAAVPGADVRVTVRGGRGMSAADMLDVLRAELAARPYQLVIWQTGTVEAVRNLPPADFAQVLSDGAALVQDAGADLVLVDPQFSRFLQTNANLEPYAQALQQVASMPGVLLFHRYDLMRTWVNEGQIDLERTPKAERQKAVEALHLCLGAHLARLLSASARN